MLKCRSGSIYSVEDLPDHANYSSTNNIRGPKLHALRTFPVGVAVRDAQNVTIRPGPLGYRS